MVIFKNYYSKWYGYTKSDFNDYTVKNIIEGALMDGDAIIIVSDEDEFEYYFPDKEYEIVE